MKKPWLAFLLSFLVAGAGLAYVGKWKWAAVNFFGVLVAAIIFARYIPDEWLRSVAAGVCAGSGSVARSLALSMNAKRLQLAQPPPDGP